MLFALALALTACNGGKSIGESSKLTNEDLVGTWETTRVAVKLVDAKGSSQDSSFVLPQGTGKPPVTYFYANGTYRNDLFSPAGEVAESGTGYWHLTADSLYMRSESVGMESVFHIKGNVKSLSMFDLVDWDGDGKRDDEMEVRLTKK